MRCRKSPRFLVAILSLAPSLAAAQSKGRSAPIRDGSSPLSAVETLSRPDRYDKYPSIAFDRPGNLWCAFTSTDRGKDVVVVRRKSAGSEASGGAWGPEERLDAGDGIESGAKLLVDSSGAVRAFWHGRRKGTWSVFMRAHGPTGWGPEHRISPPSMNGLHPAAALDRDGRIWVAFETTKPGGFSVALVAESRSSWTVPSLVESSGTDRRPALAPAPDGGVWLAWDSTRSGNFDIWLAHARAAAGQPLRLDAPRQVTSDAAIDESPSIASAPDGALWVAWNSMRGHAGAATRADRHSGDAFVRILRGDAWLAPPGVAPSALPGQVSFGMTDKSAREAVDPYWHWKQTQNYPSVFLDGKGRAVVVWRTDATGAHNFDLWARVHDGKAWSPELHLTTFSPGRDEFPSAALAPDGTLQLAWEAQALPAPGDTSKFQGGDVDAYNTRANHNVVLTARLSIPEAGWTPAEPVPVADRFDPATSPEPMTKGPEPRTATTRDGPWHVYFGDPHSHSILSDAKTGLPDQLLALSRDRLGLDFEAVSDHAEMGILQPSEYAEIRLTANVFTEPRRFVAMTGWEWTAGPAFGHRVILYGDDGSPDTLSSAEPPGDTIEKLYRHEREHGGVMSPHHTANATWGRWNPSAPHDETLEPNFEIASWHGRYEFYGNPREGRRQVPGHQYQDALRLGRHVGVMGASDTHHLTPGEGGLTAVLAERLDRASIFDAIRNRRNYATTGARIVLEFTANGAPMGSIVSGGGSLEMSVRVEGTAAVDRVEIVRNLVDTFAAIRLEQAPDGPDGVFLIYEPSDPQGGRRQIEPDTRHLVFRVKDTAPPPGESNYYVRVTQADGEQAWSSPIWVKRAPSPR